MADAAVVEPGRVISGFRVERLIGDGSLGSVYEATQLSLGRTVALRLIEERRFADPAFAERFAAQQRRCASLHHPALVPTYEAGAWDDGKFVATRFVRGRTLADHVRDGSLPPWPVDELLVPVAEALGTAHAAGLAHGRMSAQNVLVDEAGRAYLADLGLGREGDPAADRLALEALTTEAGRAAGTRAGRRPAVRMWALGIAGLVAAGISLWVTLGGEDGSAQLPAPAGPPGTVAVGSALGPGSFEQGGCAPRPSPNTPECTVVQESVEGEPTLVSDRGVIRQWAVRGAQGRLALAVFYERDGDRIVRGFTQAQEVDGPEPVAFPADVPVRPGDRVGLIVAPGARVGMRGGQDSIFGRAQGGLPGSAQPADSTPVEGELLLRVDVDVGARPEPPTGLTGPRARTADAGRTLAELVIPRPGGGSAKVRAVSVEDEVAVDLFLGDRRLQRVQVGGADPAGTLIELQRHCGTNQGFCIRWSNEGGTQPVFHEYVLGPDGRSLVTIG